MTTGFIINHLWQSSCFAALAAVLALLLRKNSPKVRYWVWLSASLKFLVPFALLVSLGSVAPRPVRHAVSVPPAVLPNTLVQIAEPFSPAHYTVPAHAPLDWVPLAIGIVWALGLFANLLVRYRSWTRIRANLQASTPVDLPIPFPACIAPGVEEPGVVGFLRPVLMLPAQLLEHLNPQQLDAVLKHELCHVRRRDNLFAAVHMVVEAIFWFHPLVWWIGARMVEERELACDEEVLRLGCEPTDYVEGILKVCRFHTASPLPCISGVTGADVKKRLRAILTGRIAHELTAGKKLVLAATALAVLSAPIVVGVLTAPAIRAQSAPRPKFETVSIKPCKLYAALPRGGAATVSSDRVNLNCVAVSELIRQAYVEFANGHLNDLLPRVPIEGGPEWINSDGYQIDAKAVGSPGGDMLRGPAMQGLLEERFKLKIRHDGREIPVYTLTVARGGPKLEPAKEGCRSLESNAPQFCLGGPSPGDQGFRLRGVTIAELCKFLSLQSDRPTIDKTGIAGRFDVPLPGRPGQVQAFEPLRRAAQELGLELQQAVGPGEILVIDSVERPLEN